MSTPTELEETRRRMAMTPDEMAAMLNISRSYLSVIEYGSQATTKRVKKSLDKIPVVGYCMVEAQDLTEFLFRYMIRESSNYKLMSKQVGIAEATLKSLKNDPTRFSINNLRKFLTNLNLTYVERQHLKELYFKTHGVH